jgi:CheY-like chemotaxis protein
MTAHRVLVVEDDLEIRESMMEILEEHGYEPVGAENGLEALDKLRSSGPLPCLILLDLMMPRMDGRPSVRPSSRARSSRPFRSS